MGEARRRSPFEERKAQAIAEGRVKSKPAMRRKKQLSEFEREGWPYLFPPHVMRYMLNEKG